MTQNLKSFLKLAFKSTQKSNQNSIKKKKKLKNFLKPFHKQATKATPSSSSASTAVKYLTRYNCKNKQIDNSTLTNNGDDTISNLMPFKAIQTQLLIPPPAPPLPTTQQEMMMLSGNNKMTKLRNQIELKLISADKNKPANIPMLVVRSYKANSSISLKQISIRKGSAVNALYMLCNNWVYVKTFEDDEGFIPKYCFESFSVSNQSLNNDVTITNETTNHTYISIVENNNNNGEKLREEYMREEMEEEDDDEEITNLSLFSVSRCFNVDSTILTTTTTASRRTTKSVKSYSKKFYFKSTTNKQHRQYNLRSVDKRLKKVKIAASEIKLRKKNRNHSVSSSSTGSSSLSSPNGNTYDLLVKCSSKEEKLKAENKTVFKVLCDYTADFKDDISVKRGDFVYSVNEDFNNKNKDWIYVRPYNNKSKQNNESDTDSNDGGFIPRDYLILL